MMTPMIYKKRKTSHPEIVMLLGTAIVEGKLQGIVMHDPREDKWQACPYDKVKLNSLRPLASDIEDFFGTASIEAARNDAKRFEAMKDWRENIEN